MKDNFLLKKSQKEVFDELSNEEAGKLIKGIFKYANTGNSELEGYLKIIFIPIKTEIDKNEEKYEEVCKRNRENGRMGGRPRREEENQEVINETEENRTVLNKTEENQEVIDETEENRTVLNETSGNPKNPINHNHIHNHKSSSSIINQNQLSNNYLDSIKQIINYLNLKTKSKFKYTTKTTQTKINARLNEGYKLNDFIAVIDKKHEEWKGTEFEKYICPETLFGTKFEKYLNQKTTSEKKTLREIPMSDIEHAIVQERTGGVIF